VLFPLGGYRKTDVRKRAKELNLPAAERPESQEICFVPDNRYRAFLKENAPEAVRPGEIVSTDGRVLGKHDGIAFFTVGQRRKLGVAAGSRLYVVRIEPETNRVVLGKHEDLMTNEAFVTDVNLIALDQLRSALHVTVKVRYRSPFIPASVEPAGQGRIRISFDHPVPGICPGQAAVFYDGDVVVGGGVIEG
jgi:tRNA-specific 2-thiouridylase